ncbi:MAG: FmdB family transcriptional regulator [Thermotogae bacterium]|nr:FmdB family transcriptional regulator [Thermotogota bacterium]MCP5465959.1 FmdB family transcriptional regulator [Thermotogota bacterium]HOO75620.1 zinc ribbon domain-containing protein [Tepiditoga sp.]
MPIYRYICSSCGNEFTELKNSNENTSEAICEKCGAVAERAYANIGISFKGNGYYVTDSRKNTGTSSK